jgi:carbon storage regulator
MLVLSRQRDESIVIGDQEITITVVCIRGDKVRIGITAPKDITVHRKEVFEAIQRENRRAAEPGTAPLNRSPSSVSATDSVAQAVAAGSHKRSLDARPPLTVPPSVSVAAGTRGLRPTISLAR